MASLTLKWRALPKWFGAPEFTSLGGLPVEAPQARDAAVPRVHAVFPGREVQALWFAAQRAQWTSLAVVPSHPGGSALSLARGLAATGSLIANQPVKLIDAWGVELGMAAPYILEMSAHVSKGGLALVSVDSVVGNPAVLPLVLAADAVLLCVELGAADLASARRTVELVGASRIVGAVATHPGALPDPAEATP